MGCHLSYGLGWKQESEATSHVGGAGADLCTLEAPRGQQLTEPGVCHIHNMQRLLVHTEERQDSITEPHLFTFWKLAFPLSEKNLERKVSTSKEKKNILLALRFLQDCLEGVSFHVCWSGDKVRVTPHVCPKIVCGLGKSQLSSVFLGRGGVLPGGACSLCWLATVLEGEQEPQSP